MLLRKVGHYLLSSSTNRRLLGTCIVTGSNSGIGKATATELVRRGATKVILACRNTQAAEQTRQEIVTKTGRNNVAEVRQLDLTSFDSVKQFVDAINGDSIQVDVLINNAGILPPSKAETTKDGFELTFQTNFLGHFLLTNLLLDNLRRAPSGARVINAVADPRAFYLIWPPYGLQFYEKNRSYNQLQAYIQSKLAISLANTRALHLKMRQEKTKVLAFSVDPGVMDPAKGRNTSPVFKAVLSALPRFLFKTFEQGAETALHCATASGLEQHSGGFFQNSKPIGSVCSRATDDAMAQRLWQLSRDQLQRYLSIDNDNNRKQS